MHKKIIPVLVIAVVLIVVSLQFFKKEVPTVFHGTAEMEQINISAEAAGIVKEIKVAEGQIIDKDAIIAVIDSPESEIRSQQAELGMQSASNEMERVNIGAREEELAAQKAAVKQMKAQADAAVVALKQGEVALKQAEINTATALETYNHKDKLYRDALALFKDGSISKQDLDTAELGMITARNVYETAKANIEGAKAQLDILRAQQESYKQQLEAANQKLLMLTNGAVNTAKTAAELGIKQAETNYELSKLSLSKTEIRSGIRGVVGSVNYSIGEYVLPGSAVATVANTDNLWVKIFVPEGLLPQLKLNQEVAVHSDFIKENIKGKIVNISNSAEYTPMNIITKDDRERLVYSVKIQIMDNTDNIKAGMLLDVQLK